MKDIIEMSNPVDVYAAVMDCYEKSEEKIFVGISSVDFTAHGILPGTSKRQELQDRNFLQCSYFGGTCIGYVGNVFICAVTKNRSKYIHKFGSCIKDFLATKGIEAELIGNDVIYHDEDGRLRKVASGGNCCPGIGKMWCAAFQISIHIDEDYVRNMCTKPVEKYPSSLDRFGITGDEVLNYLYENLLRGELNEK